MEPVLSMCSGFGLWHLQHKARTQRHLLCLWHLSLPVLGSGTWQSHLPWNTDSEIQPCLHNRGPSPLSSLALSEDASTFLNTPQTLCTNFAASTHVIDFLSSSYTCTKYGVVTGLCAAPPPPHGFLLTSGDTSFHLLCTLQNKLPVLN